MLIEEVYEHISLLKHEEIELTLKSREINKQINFLRVELVPVQNSLDNISESLEKWYRKLNRFLH